MEGASEENITLIVIRKAARRMKPGEPMELLDTSLKENRELMNAIIMGEAPKNWQTIIILPIQQLHRNHTTLHVSKNISTNSEEENKIKVRRDIVWIQI